MDKEPPINRTNLIIMIGLIVILVIGIIVRRQQIKTEIDETVEFYKDRMEVKSDSI